MEILPFTTHTMYYTTMYWYSIKFYSDSLDSINVHCFVNRITGLTFRLSSLVFHR